MDGPVRLGHRSVSLSFETDRHAGERIEQAYRLMETLAIDSNPPTDSVQVDSSSVLSTVNSTSEIKDDSYSKDRSLRTC